MCLIQYLPANHAARLLCLIQGFLQHEPSRSMNDFPTAYHTQHTELGWDNPSGIGWWGVMAQNENKNTRV